MKTFSVSKIDFEVLLTVYKLLDRGGKNESLARSVILNNSAISRQSLSYRIKNAYLLQDQLKEKIQ